MMIQFEQYIQTVVHTELVIIYPGRFQPAHKNHASVFNNIQNKFPTAFVYVSTTDTTNKDSPFNFNERKIMLEAAGIPAESIIKCSNPYVADEIKSRHDLKKTKILFAVGGKDMLPPTPRFKVGLKKDGSPTYMQISEPSNLFDLDNLKLSIMHTAESHSYVCIAPTLNFNLNIGSNSITIFGATQIRSLYRESSIKTRKDIIYQLYGDFDKAIFELFNKKLM